MRPAESGRSVVNLPPVFRGACVDKLYRGAPVYGGHRGASARLSSFGQYTNGGAGHLWMTRPAPLKGGVGHLPAVR